MREGDKIIIWTHILELNFNSISVDKIDVVYDDGDIYVV